MKERKKEDGLIAQEDTDSANSKKRRRILDDTGLREASRSKKSKKPTKQHEICTEKSAKDQNIKTESTFTWIEGQISGADSIEHSEHKNKMGKKRMSGLVDVTEFPAGATSEILDNESSRGERSTARPLIRRKIQPHGRRKSGYGGSVGTERPLI